MRWALTVAVLCAGPPDPRAIDRLAAEVTQLDGRADHEQAASPRRPPASLERAHAILAKLAARGTPSQTLQMDEAALGISASELAHRSVSKHSGEAWIHVSRVSSQDKAGTYTSERLTLYLRRGGAWASHGY